MNKKALNKFAKQTIEETEMAWAQNWCAMKIYEEMKEPAPKDTMNYESAKHNLDRAVNKIEWYKNLLKTE